MLNIFEKGDFCCQTALREDAPSRINYQLSEHISTDLVSNVRTQLAILQLENQSYLLTVNQKEYANAIVCSPYTTYVTYPLSELKKIPKWWIKSLVILNTGMMFCICRLTKFNQNVQVNNNLNSLLNHPKELSIGIKKITKSLQEKYPSHAIIFPRINEKLDSDFLNKLKENNYIVFPDRISHIFFPENVMRRSHTKRDMSLLRKTHYTIVLHKALTENDALRFSELYYELFVNKHSKKNPIYTEKYFSKAIINDWHEYIALKNNENQIDGFISWFIKDNIMFCGPLGYDPEVDRKTGVYRQLVALCLKHAAENNFTFNMGGGSDEFKLNRGSVAVLDYTAVYCNHLPLYRKIPWKIFQWSFNKFLKKIMTEGKF